MCLQDQVIDNGNGGVVRVRRARRLSYYRGVRRGREIRNSFEISKTTNEAAGDRRRSQRIYDNDGGVGGGR